MIKNTIRIALLSLALVQCKTTKKTTSPQITATSPQKPSQQVQTPPPVERFIPPNTNAGKLTGTWVFDYFTNVNQDKKTLFPEKMPTINFDNRNNKCSGMAGCNNFNGTYSASAGYLKFIQPLATTRMSCNAMGEPIFLKTLENVFAYSVEENTLSLLGNNGKALIVFKKVAQ